jgi:hypothetical protein
MLRDYPEMDYPATLDDAKLRLEQEEARMSRFLPTGQVKARTFATLGEDDRGGRGNPHAGRGNGGRGNGGRGRGTKPQRLKSQHDIPKDFKSYKFKKTSNGHGTYGRQLKSTDKPSQYGFMFCPECSKKGYKRNDHFVFFHEDFMSKVIGKKDIPPPNPPTPTVNAVTKEDFLTLGKTIAESLTAGFETLKQ